MPRNDDEIFEDQYETEGESKERDDKYNSANDQAIENWDETEEIEREKQEPVKSAKKK